MPCKGCSCFPGSSFLFLTGRQLFKKYFQVTNRAEFSILEITFITQVDLILQD